MWCNQRDGQARHSLAMMCVLKTSFHISWPAVSSTLCTFAPAISQKVVRERARPARVPRPATGQGSACESRLHPDVHRSEERRVGKECRSQTATYLYMKK